MTGFEHFFLPASVTGLSVTLLFMVTDELKITHCRFPASRMVGIFGLSIAAGVSSLHLYNEQIKEHYRGRRS